MSDITINENNVKEEVKKSLSEVIKQYDKALEGLAKGPDDEIIVTD